MAYQRSVVLEIARQARKRYGADGWSKPERRKVRSAYLTGIVESGLRNLGGGDSDSAGWRQERASLYPNPTNVRASVKRYFNEADSHYHGQSAAALSGDVQRPAAQYLGRYGEHRDEGIRLFKKFVRHGQGPVGGKFGAAASGRTTDTVIPGVPIAGAGRAAPPPLGEIASPEFSAQSALKMPQGYRGLPTSTASSSAPAEPSIDERLAALPQHVFSGVPGGAGGKGGGGGKGGATGPLEYGGNYSGTRRLAKPAFAIGRQMGIKPSSTKRATKYTDSGNISDHWIGNKQSYAIDFDTPGINSRSGYRLARALAKRYGVNFQANSYASGGTIKVGGRSFRIQLLYGSGVGHGDHVHIGIEAV